MYVQNTVHNTANLFFGTVYNTKCRNFYLDYDVLQATSSFGHPQEELIFR